MGPVSVGVTQRGGSVQRAFRCAWSTCTTALATRSKNFRSPPHNPLPLNQQNNTGVITSDSTIDTAPIGGLVVELLWSQPSR